MSISACSAEYCEAYDYSSDTRHVRAVGFGFTQKYPAPDITVTDVNASRTSIDVSLSVAAGDALVYCAAFSTAAADGGALKYGRQPHALVARQSFIAEVGSLSNITVSVTGLHPFSDYKLYCSSANTVSGASLPDEFILETETLVRTECCRDIVVDVVGAPWYMGGEYRKEALRVALPFVPEGDAKFFNVSVTLVNATSGLSLIPSPFDPSSIMIITSTASSERSFNQIFAILPPDASDGEGNVSGPARIPRGNYSIYATLNGPDARNYDIVHTRSTDFVVLDDRDSIPPPTVSRAAFSDDYTHVILTFSGPTNMAGSSGAAFECSALLYFPTDALTNRTVCGWASTQTVQISGSELVIGDVLTFKKKLLTSDCPEDTDEGFCLTNKRAMAVSIEAPSSGVFPTITIAGLRMLPACETAVIELGNAVGGGGRAFSFISIHVQSPDADSAAAVQMYIGETFDGTGGGTVVRVPATTVNATGDIVPLLLPGMSYTFSATPCNFAGACGQSGASSNFLQVAIMPTNEPAITMVGELYREVDRGSPVTVQIDRSMLFKLAATGGFTDFPQCFFSAPVEDAFSTMDKYEYTWQVFVDSVLQVNLVNERKSRAHEFYLSPYRLAVNVTYEVLLEVVNVKTRVRIAGTEPVVIYTAPQGVRAEVAGGITHGVQYMRNTTLDLRGSQDLDLDPSVLINGVGSGLENIFFDYTCYRTLPSYLSSCDEELQISLNSDAAFVTITPLFHRGVFILTVIARKGALFSNKKRVELTVISEFAPRVSISPSSLLNFKTGDALFMRALVQWNSDPSGLLGKGSHWQGHTRGLDTDSTYLAPIGLRGLASNNITLMSHPRQPSVSQLALLDASTLFITSSTVIVGGMKLMGGTYHQFTFNLHFLEEVFTGTGVVETNPAPLPGVLSCLPSNGTMDDTFEFSALYWTDEDLPLTYSFGYLTTFQSDIIAAKSRVHEVSLVRSSTKSTGHSVDGLVVGDDASDYLRYAFVRVFDSLQSSTRIEESMTVYPVPLEVRDAFFNASFVTMTRGEADAKVQALVLMTDNDVGFVSCANAPTASDCAEKFRRRRCSKTPDTCGRCMSGFLGSSNDANEMCLDPGIDIDDGQGVVNRPPKKCQRDCSDHGKCTFFDQRNHKVEDCRAADSTCVAQCVCDTSYRGVSCALSEDELDDAKSRTTSRISFLQGFVGDYDLDESRATDLIMVLSKETQSGDVIDQGSRLNVLEAIKVLSGPFFTEEGGMGGSQLGRDSIESLMEVTDNCVVAALRETIMREGLGEGLHARANVAFFAPETSPSSRRQLTRDMFLDDEMEAVEAAIVLLGKASMAALFEGQDYHDGLYQALKHREYAPVLPLTGFHATVPMSTVSEARGNIFSVDVVSGFTEGIAPKFSLTQIDSKALTSELRYSDSFMLQIDDVDACVESAETCVVDIHLPHFAPVQYFRNVTKYVSECEAKSTETFHYACPDDQDYSITCPGAANDTLIYSYCDFFEAPVCQDWATTAQDNKLSNCTRLAYSKDFVSCRCEVLSSASIDTDWQSLPYQPDGDWVPPASLPHVGGADRRLDVNHVPRRLKVNSATSGSLISRMSSVSNWEHIVTQEGADEVYLDMTVMVVGSFIGIFMVALFAVWILMLLTWTRMFESFRRDSVVLEASFSGKRFLKESDCDGDALDPATGATTDDGELFPNPGVGAAGSKVVPSYMLDSESWRQTTTRFEDEGPFASSKMVASLPCAIETYDGSDRLNVAAKFAIHIRRQVATIVESVRPQVTFFRRLQTVLYRNHRIFSLLSEKKPMGKTYVDVLILMTQSVVCGCIIAVTLMHVYGRGDRYVCTHNTQKDECDAAVGPTNLLMTRECVWSTVEFADENWGKCGIADPPLRIDTQLLSLLLMMCCFASAIVRYVIGTFVEDILLCRTTPWWIYAPSLKVEPLSGRVNASSVTHGYELFSMATRIMSCFSVIDHGPSKVQPLSGFDEGTAVVHFDDEDDISQLKLSAKVQPLVAEANELEQKQPLSNGSGGGLAASIKSWFSGRNTKVVDSASTGASKTVEKDDSIKVTPLDEGKDYEATDDETITTQATGTSAGTSVGTKGPVGIKPHSSGFMGGLKAAMVKDQSKGAEMVKGEGLGVDEVTRAKLKLFEQDRKQRPSNFWKLFGVEHYPMLGTTAANMEKTTLKHVFLFTGEVERAAQPTKMRMVVPLKPPLLTRLIRRKRVQQDQAAQRSLFMVSLDSVGLELEDKVEVARAFAVADGRSATVFETSNTGRSTSAPVPLERATGMNAISNPYLAPKAADSPILTSRLDVEELKSKIRKHRKYITDHVRVDKDYYLTKFNRQWGLRSDNFHVDDVEFHKLSEARSNLLKNTHRRRTLQLPTFGLQKQLSALKKGFRKLAGYDPHRERTVDETRLEAQNDLYEGIGDMRDIGDCIAAASRDAQDFAAAVDDQMRLSAFSDEEKGRVVLLEWMTDQLGRDSIECRAFRAHADHGCIRPVGMTSVFVKVLTVLAIVFLNVVMVLATLEIIKFQTEAWIITWGLASGAVFLMENFCTETFSLVCTKLLIPDLLDPTLKRLADKMDVHLSKLLPWILRRLNFKATKDDLSMKVESDAGTDISQRGGTEEFNAHLPLNANDFMYTSTYLGKRSPLLPESLFVLQYRDAYPEKTASKWSSVSTDLDHADRRVSIQPVHTAASKQTSLMRVLAWLGLDMSKLSNGRAHDEYSNSLNDSDGDDSDDDGDGDENVPLDDVLNMSSPVARALLKGFERAKKMRANAAKIVKQRRIDAVLMRRREASFAGMTDIDAPALSAPKRLRRKVPQYQSWLATALRGALLSFSCMQVPTQQVLVEALVCPVIAAILWLQQVPFVSQCLFAGWLIVLFVTLVYPPLVQLVANILRVLLYRPVGVSVAAIMSAVERLGLGVADMIKTSQLLREEWEAALTVAEVGDIDDDDVDSGGSDSDQEVGDAEERAAATRDNIIAFLSKASASPAGTTAVTTAASCADEKDGTASTDSNSQSTAPHARTSILELASHTQEIHAASGTEGQVETARVASEQQEQDKLPTLMEMLVSAEEAYHPKLPDFRADEAVSINESLSLFVSKMEDGNGGSSNVSACAHSEYSDEASVTDYSNLSDVDSDVGDNDEYINWVEADEVNTRMVVLGTEQQLVMDLIAKDARWRSIRTAIIGAGKAEVARQMENIVRFKAQQLRRGIKRVQRAAARQRRIRTAFADAASLHAKRAVEQRCMWRRMRVGFKAEAKRVLVAHLTTRSRWRRVQRDVMEWLRLENNRHAESRFMAHEDALAHHDVLCAEMKREYAERDVMFSDEKVIRKFNTAEAALEAAERDGIGAEESSMRVVLAGWAAAEKAERELMGTEEELQREGRKILRRRMCAALLEESRRRTAVDRMGAEDAYMVRVVAYEVLMAKQASMRAAIMKRSRAILMARARVAKELCDRRNAMRQRLLGEARRRLLADRKERIRRKLRCNFFRVAFVNAAREASQMGVDKKLAAKETKAMARADKESVKLRKFIRAKEEFEATKAAKQARKAARQTIRLERTTRQNPRTTGMPSGDTAKEASDEDENEVDEKHSESDYSESQSESQSENDSDSEIDSESEAEIEAALDEEMDALYAELNEDSSELDDSEDEKEYKATAVDEGDVMQSIRDARAKKKKEKEDDDQDSDGSYSSGSRSYSGSSRSSSTGSSFSGSRSSGSSSSGSRSRSGGSSGSSLSNASGDNLLSADDMSDSSDSRSYSGSDDWDSD
jgi:hypothetical protein